MSNPEDSIGTEERFKLEQAFRTIVRENLVDFKAPHNYMASAFVAKAIEMGWTPPEIEWREIKYFDSYQMNAKGDIRLKHSMGSLVRIHTVRSELPVAFNDLYWVDLTHDDGILVTKNWTELFMEIWGDPVPEIKGMIWGPKP